MAEQQVTAIEGSLTQEEHTAFMLRIFMYLVTIQPSKTLTVDLKLVKDMTQDHTMSVTLEGETFTAVAHKNALNNKGRMI